MTVWQGRSLSYELRWYVVVSQGVEDLLSIYKIILRF